MTLFCHRDRNEWFSYKYCQFCSSLEKVDFNAIIDHVALTHIIKSKAGPTTTRMKRLSEVFSSYSFKIYYIKGKDMILSDFLSRQKHDDSNPHEIIPILFNMQNVLQTRYYNIDEQEEGKYLVQTRSQAKTSSIISPEVQSMDKGIDPNIRLEKQVTKPVVTPKTHILPEAKNISYIKQRLGQGRTGIKKFKFPVFQLYNKPEQPKLLPGRKPIIQIAERPMLQQSKILHNLKQDKKSQYIKFG